MLPKCSSKINWFINKKKDIILPQYPWFYSMYFFFFFFFLIRPLISRIWNHLLGCAQLLWCATVCNPKAYSPRVPFVHGVSQARKLEWIVISFSRGSSQPRVGIPLSCNFCIGRLIIYHWATREVHIY